MTDDARKAGLTSMELDVLDMLVNGRKTWSDTGHPILWGAAFSEIVASLHGAELVTWPKATDAGRLALAEGRQP